MRRVMLVLLGLASLCLGGLARADSITLAEKWKDLNYSAGTGNYTSTDTGTLAASLTIPGLSSLTADDWSNLEITVTMTPYQGSQFSSAVMSAAPTTGGSISMTSATFYFQGTDTNGNSVNIEKLVFSRSGNTLTITDQTQNPPAFQPPWSILAQKYLSSGGPIADSATFEVILQDNLENGSNLFVDVPKTIYITGTNTVTYDAAQDPFNNITISGAADFTAPTLTPVSPLTSAVVTSALLAVQVQATDNVGVAAVEFFFNGQDYGPGIFNGTNKWSMNFALLPGANLIQTVAADASGNSSPTNALTMTYVNNATNANLITFTEHLLDSSQTDSLGNRYVVSQDTGALDAALAVPGLGALSAVTWSNLVFTCSFGNFSFSQSLTSAVALTASTARFSLATNLNVLGAAGSVFVDAEAITISRSSNTLALVASIGNPTLSQENLSAFIPPYGYVADDYVGSGRSIQDAQGFSLTLRDGVTAAAYANISRSIYITGTDGTNYDGSGDELDNVQVSGTADYTPPTNQITAPTAGQQWSNAVFTVTGKAGDNILVTNVYCSLNNTAWTPAVSTNHWTNWAVAVSLTPGTNTVAAYAVDANGNPSTTNTVSLVYILSAPLAIQIAGLGSVSPNDNGAWLQIGKSYSLAAAPASGFKFTNWVVSTNWVGGAAVGTTNLQFIMASNLTLQADFVEVAKPTVTITAPTANQKMPSSVATVTGTAADNWRVAGLWYQLNSGAWSAAPTTNSWTNWSQMVTLTAGTNTVKAYAVNWGGNYSATSSVSFISSNTFKLQLALNATNPLSSGGLAFNLRLSTNLTGHIQYSSNLVNWVNLTNFNGTNSVLNFRDPAATNFWRRFYRAVIP
jgi:hypothetical protein